MNQIFLNIKKLSNERFNLVFEYKITFWNCVLELWIYKGYFVVKKLVKKVSIEAFCIQSYLLESRLMNYKLIQCSYPFFISQERVEHRPSFKHKLNKFDGEELLSWHSNSMGSLWMVPDVSRCLRMRSGTLEIAAGRNCFVILVGQPGLSYFSIFPWNKKLDPPPNTFMETRK